MNELEQKSGLYSDAGDGLTLADYDYPLPEELVASYPLENRSSSRMMILNREDDSVEHGNFTDLVGYLDKGDVLVLNNTKVLPSRFIGNRQGFTGEVEILLLNPVDGDSVYTCMMRPAKKLKAGTLVEIPNSDSLIEVLENTGDGKGVVKLICNDVNNAGELMQTYGQMPIPPYLNRDAEELDKTVYQTVFSKVPGAQAAPTAGLHFTPEVLESIKAKGVEVLEVTLAVSSGTFRDVRVDDVTRHEMDPEYYTVTQDVADAINAAKVNGNKVVAIGTTVSKTLETVARKFDGLLQADTDASRLFIYPGFEFSVVDCLLTNFHLPKTTLLMLVSAFASRSLIGKGYEAAVAEKYRFFSYGDCMLIR